MMPITAFTRPPRIKLQFLQAGFPLKLVSRDSMLLPVDARRSSGTNLPPSVPALVREREENAGMGSVDIYSSSSGRESGAARRENKVGADMGAELWWGRSDGCSEKAAHCEGG